MDTIAHFKAYFLGLLERNEINICSVSNLSHALFSQCSHISKFKFHALKTIKYYYHIFREVKMETQKV